MDRNEAFRAVASELAELIVERIKLVHPLLGLDD